MLYLRLARFALALGAASIAIGCWSTPAAAEDVVRFGAPTAVNRTIGAGGDQTATGIRPLGRTGQQIRRNFGRGQEVQGRDRLCRLSIQYAARGAVIRANDHPGQCQLPVRAVRLRRRPRRRARFPKNTRCRRLPPRRPHRRSYDQGYKYLFGTFTPNDNPDHAANQDYQIAGARREKSRDFGA